VQLNATVTPGSDPAPTYLWTVQSGGAGSFDDDTLEDPIFTPSTTNASVLLLTVSTTDTADVTDTAQLTAVALSAPAGAPGQRRSLYPRRVMIFGKLYTVNSVYEERALLERVRAQEQATLERLAEQASPKVEKATYRIKQVKNRINRIDQRDDYRAVLRKWDEEILTLFG
jgi:hypothetical protein